MHKEHDVNQNCYQCCLVVLVVMAIVFPAQACHTPTRAEELGQRFPDWDFVAMAHQAHTQQPRIKFNFQGQQSCVDGMAAEFRCHNVDLVGFLDMSNFFGGSGSDSWGWKHEASGRYFALLGLSHGTAFVDITVPEAPVFTGYLPSSGGTSVWRDIKVYRDHAYVVADNAGDHGLQVFDLTRLLDVSGATETFEADTVYRYRVPGGIVGFRIAHNIVINEEIRPSLIWSEAISVEVACTPSTSSHPRTRYLPDVTSRTVTRMTHSA